MNYCRLCGAELAGNSKTKSHILTRSQYVSPLTSNTRKQLLGFSSGNIFNPCQNITDNTILCKTCDNHLNCYENERRKLINFLNNSASSNQIIDAPGIDGTYIKLACLADLFRCSITSIQQFKEVSLGHHHEKLIAKYLSIGYIPNSSTYPTLISKLKTPIKLPIVHIPYKKRINKLVYYRTAMPGGIIWLTKVDSQDDSRLSNLSVDTFANTSRVAIFEDETILKGFLSESIRSMIKI